MAEIKGYVAGSPATFTPSKKSKWIEEFNDMLVTSGYSRNALTEHLINVGLAHTEKQIKPFEKVEADSLFNNAYFTPMEQELLNTSTYQQIIREFAKSLLSNSRAAMENTYQQASVPNYNQSYSLPVRSDQSSSQYYLNEKQGMTPLPQTVPLTQKTVTDSVESYLKDSEPMPITKVQSSDSNDAQDKPEEDSVDGYELADLTAEASFLMGLKMD